MNDNCILAVYAVSDNLLQAHEQGNRFNMVSRERCKIKLKIDDRERTAHRESDSY